jgi:2-amino-4-hydroxy-6-hydroxymethyldihydropteridine diphosphokinase
VPSAYLGLGSNQGDRAGYLREAVRRLEASDLRVTAESAVYESIPWGRSGQPTFLNQVISVETPLPPRALFERGQAVEAALGRIRAERWGPRTIDVDIVAYADVVSDDPRLTLPHPRAHQRAFVLAPWYDVDPQAQLPGHGPVADLLAAVTREGVEPRDDLELRLPE